MAGTATEEQIRQITKSADRYLYDEKVLITFNYKDGTKTITFDEIAAKDAPEGNGSDLGCFAPPKSLNVCKYAEVFVL